MTIQLFVLGQQLCKLFVNTRGSPKHWKRAVCVDRSIDDGRRWGASFSGWLDTKKPRAVKATGLSKCELIVRCELTCDLLVWAASNRLELRPSLHQDRLQLALLVFRSWDKRT